MSGKESKTSAGAGAGAEVDGLDKAVTRLLTELDRARSDAKKAQLELKETARAVSGLGAKGASGLLERVRVLEGENEDLRTRIGDGSEIVQRLQAKIRFLEESA